MTINFTSSSIKFHQKDNNGDACGISEIKKENLFLFLVADGVGSCVGDWKASNLCVQLFKDVFIKLKSEIKIIDRISKTIEAINTIILSESGFFKGMKSTFVVGVLDSSSSRLYYVSIGDSRLYETSNNNVTTLTKDQVKAVIRRKQDGTPITQNGAIVNAIGVTNLMGVHQLKYSVKHIDIKETTSFLMATDGFYSKLSQDNSELLKLHLAIDSNGLFNKVAKDIAQKQDDDASAIFFRVELNKKTDKLEKQRVICNDLLKAIKTQDTFLVNKSLDYLELNNVEQTFEFYDKAIKLMYEVKYNNGDIYQKLVVLLKKSKS